jgi:hypothetical protein
MFYFCWTTCACLMISKNRASFPLHDKYIWYYKKTHRSPVLKISHNLCIFASRCFAEICPISYIDSF